jgi:hypothetical protein
MGRRARAIAAALLTTASGCNGTSDVAACTDANVELIQASSYDQACSVDTDCVAIAAGNACYPCVVICATGGAINRSALWSYEADVSATTGGRETSAVGCGCPAAFDPCCRGGTCHADLECQNPVADGGVE